MPTKKPAAKSPTAETSAQSTVSGPSTPAAASEAQSAAGKKMAHTQELAASFPYNADKAGEHGDAARTPKAGSHTAPTDPSVGASTLTESASSPKVGTGRPPASYNPGNAPLDRVRVDSAARLLTTNQGIPVANNQSTLTAGFRGPALLEDFVMREKITHFDHERIPERVVHARGSAAHGYFECYAPLGELTRASVFAEAGKRTPAFVRFSTVAGERGSTDVARDIRGFAVKLYTDEGNWDLVGNNIPVFFIQDAMKFPDLIHAVKPEPHHGMPQAASAHDTFWDFVSLMPESMHVLMWVMSDRAIPRSYRMMQGFGVHTYRFVAANGDARFVKFHWSPKQGTCSLVWDEAVKISGADPDFHRRDLWEAIEAGAFPEWELAVQVFTEEEAERFSFDVLDPTKLVPEELVPLTPIGKLVLDRNPDNFFAETEQVAFCVANIVPGIDFTNDPLLAGRIHSYLDTQISRLGGANFHEIPINASVAQVHNNQRDGMHRQAIPRGRVAYEPNSLGGGCPFQAGARGFTSFPQPTSGEKVRGKPEKFAEHFAQASLFWTSQSPIEQAHIADAFRFELTRVQVPAIRARVLSMLRNVAEPLAAKVAEGLGMDLPDPMPRAAPAPKAEVTRSPSLSLLARPAPSVETRRIAILVADGVDGDGARALHAALSATGAVPRFVGPRLGKLASTTGAPLEVEITVETAPAPIWDAMVVADGKDAAAALAADGRVIEFVQNQYRHCKPMLFVGAAAALCEELELEDDDALLRGAAKDTTDGFVAALQAHRFFGRETSPPVV